MLTTESLNLGEECEHTFHSTLRLILHAVY